MRLDDQETSSNVEDRRGIAPSAGSLGVGTLIIALAASYFFGIDPRLILGLASNADRAPNRPVSAQKPRADDAMATFVSKILASTETVWAQEFQSRGKRYSPPRLVLFSGTTPTACGTGQSATGPFYCPADQRVYIDLSFYRDLRERFKAPGELAQAYVIAHEVGHHVQHLLGISTKVHQAQQTAPRARANALSVRLELQADCFAGLWAARADAARHIIEPGEIDQALAAAAAIGDDRLQQQTQGRVAPESFTHGTSEQRKRWFKRGFEQGGIAQCDTFKVSSP